MDPFEIRRRVITALFTDPVLADRLVLKGGNALELVHRVITRGSIDVDLSIADAFEDVDDIAARVWSALRIDFESAGYLLFDESFRAVPPDLILDPMPWWGGYKGEFKLIEKSRAGELASDLDRMRRESATIDLRQGRRFSIDISKHEYCGGKIMVNLDGRSIFVYSEEMCVIEKLRAICQQMPEYPLTNRRPRSRDFYDIYSTVTRRAIDLALPENREVFEKVFAAKRVPLQLLALIASTRDFHEPDWDAVRAAVVGEVFDFGVYFDFVVAEVVKLESIWNE